MPVVRIPRFQDEERVSEYYVAAARQEITFPGLMQCISITGYHVGRLLGTHISPGATSDEVVEHFRILTTECGDHFPTWYVAGQFQNHFATPKAVMNSWDNVRKTLRANLGSNSAHYVFDTSSLTATEHWPGIDVRAQLVNGEPKFSFARALGRRDKPFSHLAHWYFNRL